MKKVASFSGGRSSGYMVCRMLELGEQIDGVVFCDTGIETPKTYELIKALHKFTLDRYGMPIHCLRFNKRSPYYSIIQPEELTLDPSVMAETLLTLQIPTMSKRVCTENIKIRANARFVLRQWDCVPRDAVNLIGFRADEPKRIRILKARLERMEAIMNMTAKERRIHEVNLPPIHHRLDAEVPMEKWGTTRADVIAWWKGKQEVLGLNFDPSDPAIRLSNCIGCYFSSIPALVQDWKDYPAVMEMWAKAESIKYCNKMDFSEMKEARERRVKEFLNWFERTFNTKYKGDRSKLMGYWRSSFYPVIALKNLKTPGDLFGEAQWGGCGDGACNTDLAV